MIKLNNTDITIRPSAVNSFFSCPYQWGKTYLEGVSSIPNSRAGIGTAIHSAAETFWTDAIESGNKDCNETKAKEAALQSWDDIVKEGVSFDEGENSGTAAIEIINGASAFIEDIAPFVPIPKAVERRYTVIVPNNPMVKEISGTVDYITNDTIADVKTSKRKVNPQAHTIQQSIYKWLANENGVPVKHNMIHSIVLKKSGVDGSVLAMDSNVAEAQARIKIILDTMDLIAKDVAPIEQILRPNPTHYLCSKKYCSQWDTCPAIKEL